MLLPWLLRTLRRAAWAPILVFGLHTVSSLVGLYGLWPPRVHLGGLAFLVYARIVTKNASPALSPAFG